MTRINGARWVRASAHLDHVLDLPPAERAAYVAALGDNEPDTAADLEALLERHRRLSAEGFLDAPPEVASREPALAGLTLGSYMLESRLGQGGMGSVWLASRSDGHFVGRAAVKLLNAALIGRGGEGRFRREGTILARLAHPHIARLIDAGVSETGQPYLVLEFIDGRHIDTYCDQRRLTIEARIRLFLDVLSAVAHAHKNLIVHRDIKPPNVLVDGSGQVKLLDFSIAKLIEDDETSRLTQEAGPAMTPRYAAPEQLTGGVVTTATDVYALGVLLYELLSGQHPVGRTPTGPSAFVRALAEREPVRLSAALDAAGPPDALAAVAAARSTTPERLARALGGDLETILGKALKKEPAERYGSVVEFADDLRRYLTHQPIAARPDAFGYRAAKFVRRHRKSVGATVAATLIVGALVGFYTVRLAQERDRARVQAEKASRASALLASVLTSADPFRDRAGQTVRDLLDTGAERIARELGDQPELQAELFTAIGRTYARLGIHDRALPMLEDALAKGRQAFGPEHLRVAQSLNDLGVLHRSLGSPAAAEPLLVESLGMRRRLLGSDHNDVAITLVELARVLRERGRTADAEPLAREALAIRTRVLGDEHRETATSKNELARLLWDRGDLDEAERLFRENLSTTERVLGPRHPNVSGAKTSLALLLVARGDAGTGERLLREALDIDRAVFGDAHWEIGFALSNLSAAVEARGRLAETERLIVQAMDLARPQLGADHPGVVSMAVNLARVRLARGRAAGVEPLVRHALDVRRRLYAEGDWRIAQAEGLLGAALLAEGRDEEAETLMLAADRVLRPVPGRQADERAANRARLAALYRTRGDAARAAEYR